MCKTSRSSLHWGPGRKAWDLYMVTTFKAGLDTHKYKPYEIYNSQVLLINYIPDFYSIKLT